MTKLKDHPSAAERPRRQISSPRDASHARRTQCLDQTHLAQGRASERFHRSARDGARNVARGPKVLRAPRKASRGIEWTMAAFDASANADRSKFNVDLIDEADFRRKTEVFEQWLLDNGAEFPQLEIKCYDDEVRGVHAKEDIKSDTLCISIPLNCLITVEMGKVRGALHGLFGGFEPPHAKRTLDFGRTRKSAERSSTRD
eukprot:scaffold664_cov260-Pinguiococcus_pyrenoidosus.AAC.36